jgi:hypothetical protein
MGELMGGKGDGKEGGNGEVNGMGKREVMGVKVGASP